MFANLFNLVSNHKKSVFSLFLLFFLLTSATLLFLNYSNDLSAMLPSGGKLAGHLKFLRESNLSNNIVISLKLNSDKYDTTDLFKAADKLSASLDSPLISDTRTGIEKGSIKHNYRALWRNLPSFFDRENMKYLRKETQPSNIKKRVRDIYKTILKPGGSFSTDFVKTDPLGLTHNIFKRIRNLSASITYKTRLKNGHFLSRDGKHTMIIIDTPVKSTEISASRRLLSYLNKQLEILPDYIDAHVIGAHNHTVSNAGTIKRDITINMLGIGLIFVILVVFIFRDYRGILIFVIPFLTFPAAILTVSLIHQRVSFFIIGFGAAIAGIGVDYGIHVYIAGRSGQKRKISVGNIARPLTIGAVTTITAFCAFYFSSITGYHQLATFSIVSLGICLVLALFGLPHFLKTPSEGGLSYLSFKAEEFSRSFKIFVLVLWIGSLIVFFAYFDGVEFKKNLKQLDGTASDIIEKENKFRNTWLRWDRRAILVVKGNSRENALKTNKHIYDELKSKIKTGSLVSPASVIPSKTKQKANIENWNKFWSKEKIDAVKNRLIRESRKYGFSSDAFSPFFNLIEKDYSRPDNLIAEIPVLTKLEKTFLSRDNGEYKILTFLKDSEYNRKTLSEVCNKSTSAFYISPNKIFTQLQTALTSELFYLSTIVAIIVLIVVTLLLRKPLLIVTSLIPVLTAVCAVLTIMSLNGMTPPGIMALILAIGLSIDYGIFMVHKAVYQYKSGTETAVALSTFTTVGGAGILTLSNHPMLYHFGLTLAPGVICGFIGACFIVPFLINLLKQRGISP